MEGGQGTACPPSPSDMIIILANRGGETSILNKPVNKLRSLCREGGGETLMNQAFSSLVTPSGKELHYASYFAPGDSDVQTTPSHYEALFDAVSARPAIEAVALPKHEM